MIGAGAAGIAAARRIMAANRKVHRGRGRQPDRRPLPHRHRDFRCAVRPRRALDAQSRHQPDDQARTSRGPRHRRRRPSGQKIRIGRRNARAGETEEFLAALVRANRAIDDASRGKADISCAAALPKDLGDWAATADFVLGANATGKDLKDLSAVDKARAQDRNSVFACRQGLGTLIAKLGEQVPVSLSTPATASSGATATSRWRRRRAGSPRAPQSSRCRATCWRLATSNSRPDMPKRQLDAAAKLSLGSYDHIALQIARQSAGACRATTS